MDDGSDIAIGGAVELRMYYKEACEKNTVQPRLPDMETNPLGVE